MLILFIKSCLSITLTLFIRLSSLVSNFPVTNLSNLLFKLIKPLGTYFNLSMSNLSTSDFKLAKSVF